MVNNIVSLIVALKHKVQLRLVACLQVFVDKQQIYKVDHFIVLDVKET